MGSFTFSPVDLGMSLLPQEIISALGVSGMSALMNAIFGGMSYTPADIAASSKEPSTNPFQPTGVTLNSPLPSDLAVYGDPAQWEISQSWYDAAPWLKDLPQNEAWGYVHNLESLGWDPPTFSTTVTEALNPALALSKALGTTPALAGGVPVAIGAGAPTGTSTESGLKTGERTPTPTEGRDPVTGEPLATPSGGLSEAEQAALIAAALSGGGFIATQTATPGAGEPGTPGITNPTFSSDVLEPPDALRGAADFSKLPVMVPGLLGGELPSSLGTGIPNFRSDVWGFNQVPYDPAPVDYVKPTTIPPTLSTAEPIKMPVDYGGLVLQEIPPPPTATTPPADTKKPSVGSSSPSATAKGVGGGAAIPPGYPVVGDPNKHKSLFDLPLMYLPENYIQPIKLGGKR